MSQAGSSIAFAPLHTASASPARTRGATASYVHAVDGATLQYVHTDQGVKENLILTDAAVTDFAYRLKLSAGLRARNEANGSISVLRAGKPIASFTAPFMRDADGVTSTRVTLRAAPVNSGWVLRLHANRAWVTKHIAKGPVTIDPTAFYHPADPDCEIVNTTPDTSSCSATALGVGASTVGSQTRVRRTLLRYTIKRWLPKGSQIFQAQLSAKVTKQPTTPTTVDVLNLTRGWDTGVTWNSYSGASRWTTPGGDYDATPVDTNTSVGDALGARETWTVTSAVQAWADSGNNNGGFGLMLKQRNEGSVQGDVEFASSETAVADHNYLAVWYDDLTGALPYSHFDANAQLTDRLSMAVNVASGNLFMRLRDLHVQGTGMDLDVDRFYNSREPVGTELGWGWSYGVGKDTVLATLLNGNVAFRGPNDYDKLFVRNADGTYAKPPGLEATLVKNADATFALTFDASGQRWDFNASGVLTKRTDRNGNAITLTYNAGGSLNQITDTQGRVTTFGHDATTGKVTSATDSTGRTQSYGYNPTSLGFEGPAGSMIVSSTDPNGKVTKFGYTTGDGSLLNSVTDPRGNTTSLTYDDQRRVTDIAWAGGGHTTFAYGTATATCGNDLNTVVTDPRGNATKYCWEAPGRVTKVVDPAGNSTNTSYTSTSNVSTVTDQAQKTTTLGYTNDAQHNLASATSPLNATQTWDYTDTSNKFSPTKATNTRGTSAVYTYDGSGNSTSIADGGSPANSTVKLEYTGQSGGVCANPAGPNGTLRCSIDARGNRTTYDRDAKGNLTKITPPVPLAATTITVDALSRVSTVTDGKGQKRTYTYDKLDRVTKIDFADNTGTVTSSTSLTYDDNGNLLTRADTTGTPGTSSYVYDARNRTTKDTLPDASTNQYGYDPAGNLTSFIDAGGTVNYAYDSRNLPSSLAEPGGSCTGTVSKCTTFSYDTRSRHTATTYPNGVTQTWSWDDDGHLTDLVAKNSAGTVLRDFAYSYTDPANSKLTDLRFSVTDAGGNKTSYAYDYLDRMTGATTKTSAGTTTDDYHYGYDPAGNVTSTSSMANGGATTTTASIYNAANQLCWTVSGSLPGGATCGSTPTGATSYAYDPNGNETQKVNPSGTTGMTYNVRDQNDSITIPGSATSNITYLGVGQQERSSAGGIGLHNSNLGLGSRASTTAGTAYFTRTADGDLVGGRPPTGTSYYYLFDGLGSVVGITDNTGAVIRTYKYDPYGNTVTNSGSGPVDYFRYTGAYNASGGLYHNGARYYDPSAQRWTQQDPLNQRASLAEANRYGYVGDDPIDATDPSGLFLGISHRQFQGIVEVGAGVGALTGAVIGQAACTAATDGLGAAHCATATLPIGQAGFGLAADGVRRIVRRR